MAKVLNGSNGNDSINGTPGDDVINGNGGNDVINAGAGNDLVNGGAGNDTIDGGDGNDLLDGGDGDDILKGGAGWDLIIGGNGNDFMTGGTGNDVIYGGNGVDTALFSGNFSGYNLINFFGLVAINGTDGTDLVYDVEFLKFDNGIYNVATRAFVANQPPPRPVVAVIASHGTGTEAAGDGTDFTYIFSRTGDLSQALTINYAINPSGTNGAVAGVDHTGVAVGQITFAAGSATASLSFNAIDDAVVEGPETFTVAITAGATYDLGTQGTASGTIVDNDFTTPVVSITAAPASVTEEQDATVRFVISRTGGDLSHSLIVNFGMTTSPPAGATAGVDFSGPAGPSVTIPAGQTSVTLTYTINEDSLVEGNEQFGVNLLPGSYDRANSSATAVIVDDDLPTLSIANASANEAAGSMTFTVALSAASTTPVSFTYSTTTGTAGSADFVGVANQPVTIAAGQTSATVTIALTNDNQVESNEAFTVSLGSPVGATIASGQATGTITDDDQQPTVDFAILFGPASTTVSTVSTELIYGRVFEAGLTEAAGAAPDIVAQLGYGNFGTDPRSDANWHWLDASFSAQIGIDDEYQASIPAPDIGTYAYTYRFGISVGGNAPTVWTYADLGGTGDGFQSDQLGTLTSTDGGGNGTITISDAAISEGNAGTSLLTFTVSRSGGLLPFTVDFATADGTATAGSDYVTASGTLAFADGENTKVIQIAINGDSTFESDETFSLHLSNASAGTVIADDTASGTIVNDDPSPVGSISIDDVHILEGNNGTAVATFTVSRSGGSQPFSVDFATSNGTATAGSDYLSASGTLSFASGEMTKIVQVTVNGDTAIEDNETFSINLSHATSGVVLADSQGTGTIVNDDDGPLDFALLLFPATLASSTGTLSPVVLGRVFESGLTDNFGAASNIVAQIGYGDFGADPTSDASWHWSNATYSAQSGFSDDYQASIVSPGAGTYAYTYRFGLSIDGHEPTQWIYADLSGSADGFQISQLGTWVVNP